LVFGKLRRLEKKRKKKKKRKKRNAQGIRKAVCASFLILVGKPKAYNSYNSIGYKKYRISLCLFYLLKGENKKKILKG